MAATAPASSNEHNGSKARLDARPFNLHNARRAWKFIGPRIILLSAIVPDSRATRSRCNSRHRHAVATSPDA
jgi:hypothetical protein